MKKIAVGFAKRQTPESHFSHFTGTEERLIALIETHWDQATHGNLDGTIRRVPVPPQGFLTSVRKLTYSPHTEVFFGDPSSALEPLTTSFVPRREGEDAVCQTSALGEKTPAKYVEIIVYHRDILGPDASTDAEWEVVSINASPLEGPIPMDPITMARNQLLKTGGTFQREYTSKEWAEAVWFWAQHANVTGL